MENYSFLADLLQTFRMMSDGVKVLLIYMPCVFALGFSALYMHHLRHQFRSTKDEKQPYAILPPEKAMLQSDIHPTLKTLRKLDSYIKTVERVKGE